MTPPPASPAPRNAQRSPGYRPQHPSLPPLRVVRRRELTQEGERRRCRLLLGAAALIVVSTMFAAVGAHAMVAQEQFRLVQLQGELSNAQTARQQLQQSVVELSSPSRIVHVAETQLGMTPPQQITYLSPVPLGSHP